MKITPLDIRRKEFKRSMRGYSDEEVDIFLDEVADEFERIFQENMELQDRAHRLDEQIVGHVQLKDALEKTLISAQLQAEELRANAHKESELILRDAELKARGIVAASYGETQRTQQALVQLKLLEEDFRFKFRSLLEGYLRLLNEAPLNVAAPEAAPVAAPAPEPTPAPVAAPLEASVHGATTEAVAVPAAVDQPVYVPEPVSTSEPVTAPEPPVFAPEPPARAYEPPAFVPVAPPFAAPPAPEAAHLTTAAERRPPLEERWPVVSPVEDTPTEESLLAVAGAAGVAAGYAVPEVDRGITDEITLEDVTAETRRARTAPLSDASQEVEPLRGFFFGRQMNDVDDTFPGGDETKKDKTRDFEW